MKSIITVTISMSIILMASTSADARGLRCGWTQMKYFGIQDPKYKLAKSWLNFPKTTAHPGAVVFQWRNGRDSAGNRGGHVARIAQVINRCTAVVVDEKGKYTRNICGRGATIVDPNGNRVLSHSS